MYNSYNINDTHNEFNCRSLSTFRLMFSSSPVDSEKKYYQFLRHTLAESEIITIYTSSLFFEVNKYIFLQIRFIPPMNLSFFLDILAMEKFKMPKNIKQNHRDKVESVQRRNIIFPFDVDIAVMGEKVGHNSVLDNL